MYLIIAKNHDEYENWIRNQFKYLGDEDDISRVDPAKVTRIIFANGYDQHPIYFTDAFLKLQLEVAAYNAVPQPKRKWYRKWL